MSQQRPRPKRPLILRGVPAALEGAAPFEGEIPSGEVRVEVEGVTVTGAQVEELAKGLARWTVSLDELTPPGDYRGVFVVDGYRTEVQLVVEPFFHLQVSPTYINAVAPPGGKTEVTFVFVNHGNAPVEIAKVYGIGLFQAHGMEAALNATYESEARGLDRVGVAAEEFASRHALARAQFDHAPVTLAPREYSQHHAVIKWPSDMVPGHNYIGRWPIGPLNLSVTVRVVPPDVKPDVKSEVP